MYYRFKTMNDELINILVYYPQLNWKIKKINKYSKIKGKNEKNKYLRNRNNKQIRYLIEKYSKKYQMIKICLLYKDRVFFDFIKGIHDWIIK